ncbi:hypothetical protein FRB99_008562 [Tulasnella sp. 403]|nr:hypothetical protein FRB99_008562 [Tulasnella sp. 403]
MEPRSFMDNVFLGSQLLISMAPVPGIAAAVIAMQEIYRLIQSISSCQQEMHQLTDYAAGVLYTLSTNYDKYEKHEIDGAVDEVKRQIERLADDVRQWERFNKAQRYIKNTEIMAKLQHHRTRLEQSLQMLSLATQLRQQDWNIRFEAARERDRLDLEKLAQQQNEMIQLVQKMQETLQTVSLSSTPRMTPSAAMEYAIPRPPVCPPNEYTEARNELFRLRNYVGDTAVLPYRDLSKEVEKLGQRPIHAGTMFDIWKGVWLQDFLVALKVFRGVDIRIKDMDRIYRQVDLWRTLSHPNILKLYGIATLDSGPNIPLYFVSPWLKNRDVVTYLKNNPDADRLKLVYEIGKGLQYLHSLNIVHSYLQGSNVLVAIDGTAVLSDFSLSKVIDGSTLLTQSNGPQSSLRWMSPEAQNAGQLTFKSDVYSWAMTALQIFSGQIPYYPIRAMGQLVVTIVIGQKKPQRQDYPSPWITDRMWDLFTQCWSEEPEQRPPVDYILYEVGEMRKERGWPGEVDAGETNQRTIPVDEGEYPCAF